MISVITIMNNESIFNEWLKKSLDLQKDIDFELVVIDNTKQQFSSLEMAYNEGIKRSKGDWLLFIHPDIMLLQNNTLKNIYRSVIDSERNNDKIRLWGVAGVEDGKFFSKSYISNIRHGNPPDQIVNNFGSRKYVIVQTVDACCFFIRRRDIEKYPFSKSFEGFHMLVEELCIRLNSLGYLCAVVPSDIWHRSNGASLDYKYFKNALKLIKKYPNLEYFNTTTMHGKINWWYLVKIRLKVLKYLLNKC